MQYECGNCYANVLIWALAHEREYPGLDIVHGYPYSADGLPWGHAWIEYGGAVYDVPPNDHWYLKDDYYRQVGVKLRHKYTLNEACELSLSQRHHGPWAECPPNTRFLL